MRSRRLLTRRRRSSKRSQASRCSPRRGIPNGRVSSNPRMPGATCTATSIPGRRFRAIRSSRSRSPMRRRLPEAVRRCWACATKTERFITAVGRTCCGRADTPQTTRATFTYMHTWRCPKAGFRTMENTPSKTPRRIRSPRWTTNSRPPHPVRPSKCTRPCLL